jgi:hypothetical protein
MEKGVITKPKRLEVDTDTLTASYGKFPAEPLERGFGTTIGNSLRACCLPRSRARRSRACGSTGSRTSSRRCRG